MKIFHTSDWHLGRMLYGRSLLEDQRYFLDEILLPALQSERPDALIVAGDLYDRQIAPTDAIALFDRFLSQMAELGIPLAVIAGNHDSADRMALGKDLLRRNGVYIATNLDDAKLPMTIEKDGEKLQVFLLPYLDPSVVRHYFQDESLRGDAACMRRALEDLRGSFDEGAKQLLVTHCFAAGSQTSDSESGIYVGGSGEVPLDIWQDFDYVALGHLHRAQKVGNNGRYSGSPLKYSVDEQDHKKSLVKLLLTEDGIQTELLPIRPLRDVRRISGEIADLLEQVRALPADHPTRQDYVEIELLDRNPVLLAAQTLREYYPNLLAVTNRWVAEAAVQHEPARKKQDDLTLFTSFLSEICGIDSGKAETAWFHELSKGIQEDNA